MAGDSKLLQYLCGALYAATTTTKLRDVDDHPDTVNQTYHLPLLRMVVSVCGESAIPLLDSQLSLMKEMRRDRRRLRDVKIFNPTISPIPYAIAEVARRLCSSAHDFTLRSSRPLGEGDIGDSARSCMAYMIKKVIKTINLALKGGSCFRCRDGVLIKRQHHHHGDEPGSNDDCSSLKEEGFDYYFPDHCSGDHPLDPRVDLETEQQQPMLYNSGSTTTTTSGEVVVVLPTRLFRLADIVFLDRLPWLWWESAFIKKSLKHLEIQRHHFALRSDDALVLHQLIPLFIPWLSVTQTLAEFVVVACANDACYTERGTTSSSAQGNIAAAAAVTDMLPSSTGMVEERPSSSLPLYTLIELALAERDNLCSVFAPWVTQYNESNDNNENLNFPWERFIVQWRRAETAMVKVISHLSVVEDGGIFDEKLEEASHRMLGLCKMISAAVLKKIGGALPLFTISKTTTSSHFPSQVVDLQQQIMQNEKPAISSRAIDAEAIQYLRSIADRMKTNTTVWMRRICEQGSSSSTDYLGGTSRDDCTDYYDSFLPLLLPLLAPSNLRADVLHALATFTWMVAIATTDGEDSSTMIEQEQQQQLRLIQDKLPLSFKKTSDAIETEFLAAWEIVKHGKLVVNGGDDDTVAHVVGKGWRDGQTGGGHHLVGEGKENEVVSIAMKEENWVMNKHIDLQLLVLAQHWAAMEELSLLVELENTLRKEEKMFHASAYGSGYHWCYHTRSWSEPMFWLRQLIHLLLEQGVCSPKDLVAHQTFLWKCESATELPLISLKHHFTCLHQSLLQMKESCFHRLWTGAFNAHDEIFSMSVVWCGGMRKPLPVQVNPNFRGPSLALQYCLRSDILFQICQGCVDGDQGNNSRGNGFDVTISNIAARSRQLRLLFDMVVNLPYKRRRAAALEHSEPALMQYARNALLKVLSMVQVALPKFPVTLSLPDLTSGIESVTAMTTERFQAVAKLLLLPAAKWLCMSCEKDLDAASSTTTNSMFDSHAGCALSLIGAFKLQLCIPAEPIDPVRLPDVEESILRSCLSRLNLDIAVRITSSVLFRGASKRPDILRVEKRRTELEKECIALRRRSAERPSSAAHFPALFNEVHVFATGLGSPEHVERLVQSLVSMFEMKGGQETLHQKRCTYLQEERVWQSAAGAFVERLHQNFTYYDDVTVPILESLGLIRAGLRIIAGAVEMHGRCCDGRRAAASSIGLGINPSVPPPSPIMFLLGDFPLSCRNMENKESEHSSCQASSGTATGETNIQSDELSSAVLATCSPNRSGGRARTEFIHAILKRIQLLLLCGAMSSSEGVSEVSRIIENYANEWKYTLSMEENRKIEDVGIFSYCSGALGEAIGDEEDCDSDEAIEQAAVRLLFPDFSSLFDVDGSEEYELPSNGSTAATNGEEKQQKCQTMTVKSEDLALIGELHASIFIAQVGRMAMTTLDESICYVRTMTRRMPWWHCCISALSDTQRKVAFETSYRAACLLQEERRGRMVSLHSSAFELASIEDRLSASHLFALSTAMELYLPAEQQRLEEPDDNGETINCHFRNTDFYRTPSPAEAVRLSIPLTVLLQSVTGLLGEFPGNAVLVALARCTEKVRGLNAQSSVAQLLAGAQIVLTKAQAWEDVASQDVSLRLCLKPISCLVVRWRTFELEGWRNLVKASEDHHVNVRAMEWWPWIHSLVFAGSSGCNVTNPPQGVMTESGGVNEPMEVVNTQNVPLKQQQQPRAEGCHKKKHQGDVFCSRQPSKHYSVDWIASVEGPFCHGNTVNDGACQAQTTSSWLWRGFPGATLASPAAEVTEDEEEMARNHSIISTPVLHSNIFDALDAFLRTSTVGEFDGRLYLIRAFSGQLACSSRFLNGEGGNERSIDASGPRLGSFNKRELSIHYHRLSLLLLRLWRHYHQFSVAVRAYSDGMKAPIEKSILDEVKLGKWDDQTYYSLAEASQRTHRKLTRLLKSYDEVLKSSVVPILHGELVKGIGEIRVGLAGGATASMEEVPSPSCMFYVVADIDGEEDLKVYSEDVTSNDVDAVTETTTTKCNDLDVSHSFAWLKENVRATSSLSPLLFSALLGSSSSTTEEIILSRGEGTITQTEQRWLKNLPALCVRMHYLVSSNLFSDDREGLKGMMCAEVAEDICAAIFHRIHMLRQYDIDEKRRRNVDDDQQQPSELSGSNKAVKKRAVLDLLQELKGQGLDARPQIPWEVKHVDVSMSLPSPFTLTSLAVVDGDCSSYSYDELWHRADRYFSRSVAELVRFRLESTSTSSHDVTQREVQAMVGFCEHLNIILLQQRAVIDAAATTLGKFEGIVHSHASLIRKMHSVVSSPCNANAPVVKETGCSSPRLPPQKWNNAVFHVDKQCRSLLRVLEGLREATLLVHSIRKNRIAGPVSFKVMTSENISSEGLVKQLDAAVDVVLGCLNNLSDWTWNEYTPMEVLVNSKLIQTLDDNAQTMVSLADSLENMCNTTTITCSGTTTTTLIPRCVLLQVASELRQTPLPTAAPVDYEGGDEEFDDEESNNNNVLQLQVACEATIEQLLLSAQKLLYHSRRKMNDKKKQQQQQHGKNLGLLESQADAYDQLKGICVGLRCSFSALETVLALLKEGTLPSSNGAGVTSGSGLLHTVTGIVELSVQVCDGARAVMRGAVTMHKSCAKLQYVLLRVFRSIVVNGLCENTAASSEEYNETGSDAGDTEKVFGSEGAGMGSGKGMKDVSSDIENEEQLLGMKDEKEDDGDVTQQPRELTKEEAQEGVEMSEDFDGGLYDVPREKEEGDEEKEGEEEDQDQMDREIGDVGDMGDVVDQGLWDDEEEDNAEDNNGEKEEYSSSGQIKGATMSIDEIRTKEDREEEPEDENGGDIRDEKNDHHPQDSDVAASAQVDETNEQDDEGTPQDDDDGPVNDQKNMDSDQDGNVQRTNDDVFQENEAQGDGQDEEAEADGDDNQSALFDNMQLDGSSDVSHGSEGEEYISVTGEDHDPMDVDITVTSDTGEMAEEEEEEDSHTANRSGSEGDSDSGGNVEEAMGTAERGASGGMASSYEENEENEKDGGGEGGSAHVQRKDGVRYGNEQEEEEDLHKDEENDDDQQGFESREEGMRRGETEGGKSYREGPLRSDEEEASSEYQRNRRQLEGPEAPNPMKIPGDALKHWERRLNVLQLLESGKEDENSEEPSQYEEGGGEEVQEEQKDKFQSYQYAKTVNEATTQALGAADEDTLEAQQSQQQMEQKGNLEEKVDTVKLEEEEESSGGRRQSLGDTMKPRQDNRIEKKTTEGKQNGGRQTKTSAVKTEEVKGDDTNNEEDNNGTTDISGFHDVGYFHSDARNNNNDNAKPMVVIDDQDLHLDNGTIAERRYDEVNTNLPPLTTSSIHVQEWKKLRAITQPLAGRLCERLRLVLMAQVASRLQGDYRSGKRINMKRVIGYIASHFRKDKIWLRRTKPAKRDYQVMLVIDDTQSMKDGREPLLQAAATAVQALAQLEIGQVGVAAFRSHLNILHAIGDPWTDEAGAKIVSGLSFIDRLNEDANVKRILREASTELLSKGGMGAMYRLSSSFMSSNLPPRQLVVLFSDGLFDEAQRNGLRLQIRGMEEKGQLVVLVIIAHDLEDGILTITNWDPEKAISRPYLDDYPFPYYLVLKDVRFLPELLSDALRQWFELASEGL